LLRGEILRAAKQLLGETGSEDAVSIRAVAELAGVTPPSIYLHFADKEALLDAVCADVFGDLDRAMQRAAVKAGDAPLERLRAQGRAYVRFATSRPEHYRLATMSVRTGMGDLDDVLASSAFGHFVATIAACQEAGIFLEGDPIPIALDLWAAAHGVAALLIAKPYLPWGDVEARVDAVLRSSVVGRAVCDRLGDPDPQGVAAWLAAAPLAPGERTPPPSRHRRGRQ
jgi:AcrR family transcriptional regulator